MLVHKGGQINNVQLITGVRIAEMSQLQNCSVMCTMNGTYCENEKKERSQGEGSGSMCTKNGSYCEKEKKVGGGGGGVRVDANEEVKLLWKFKKKNFVGRRRVAGGLGSQGGYEQRSEAFVKIKNKIGRGVSGRGVGFGRGVRVDVNGEPKFL